MPEKRKVRFMPKTMTKAQRERKIERLENQLTKLKNENIPGCICVGHVHAGGRGGCYFGGTLVPACKCKARDDD